MSISRRIAKNFLSLICADFLTKILSLVTVAYMARRLNPDSFGKISFAFAVVNYFAILTNLGLDASGTRDIAGHKDRLHDYADNILTIRFLLAVSAYLLLFGFVHVISQDADTKMLMLLYGVTIFTTALTLDWVFQGLEQMEFIGVARVILGVVYLLLILFFIHGREQLLLVPILLLAANLCSLAYAFFSLQRRHGAIRPRFDPAAWKKLFLDALPLGGSFILMAIWGNLENLLIGFVRDPAEVAFFRSAYNIVLLLVGMALAYSNVIFPVLADLHKSSLEHLERFVSQTVRISLAISLPFAVGGTILAKPLMTFVYGAQYERGTIALQILVWMFVFVSLNVIAEKGLIACGKQKKFLKVNIILLFFSLSYLVAIPLWGFVGAALVTTLRQIVALGIQYRAFSHVVKMEILPHAVKPAIASAAMAAGLLILPAINVLLAVFIGIVIYFLVFYLIGGIRQVHISLPLDPAA